MQKVKNENIKRGGRWPK